MKTVLVAGVGNIFFGDDAFGVEVVRSLSAKPLPQGVDVIDFGIRGIDLAYALTSHYAAAILVDAAQRGESPGTISIVEPESGTDCDGVAASAHNMDPAKILRMASDLGVVCERTILVLCEPLTLGGEEGAMGLSEPVAAAVGPAARIVQRLAESILDMNERNQTSAGNVTQAI
jgi:hydrogenase maturation protease